MLRNVQNARKKQTVHAPSRRKGPESENVQPTCFNTKGYFTPDEAYHTDYLKVKEEVFKKYRNQEAELVFIDPKLAKPACFIQRGLLMPKNDNHTDPKNSEKVLNNFLKNYMTRKEKREAQDEERYLGTRRESFGVSNIELSTITKPRTVARSLYSRVSTCRSACSSNKEN